MAVTRQAWANHIFCDAASDLPAAGQFVGQKAWVNEGTARLYRWTGSTWASITPGFATNGRYDPWNTPSGLDANASDEFIGSINTGLITWGNQGTATLTSEIETARLHLAASASRDRKCLFYAVPSGNWVLSTAVSFDAFQVAPVLPAYGIIVLETGSVATPTSISMLLTNRSSTTACQIGMYTSTSYTAVYTVVGAAVTLTQQWFFGPPIFLQIRYVSSSKTLSCWGSLDGMNLGQIGSNRVLGAAPVNIGLFGDQNTANIATDARFHFLRTRTDATGTSSPYPMGV